MMAALLGTGAVWTVFGLLGLAGVGKFHPKYQGKSWTESYIRSNGVAHLLLGVPWVLFSLAAFHRHVDFWIGAIIILVLSIPSLLYAIAHDRKYKAMLESGRE